MEYQCLFQWSNTIFSSDPTDLTCPLPHITRISKPSRIFALKIYDKVVYQHIIKKLGLLLKFMTTENILIRFKDKEQSQA